MIIDLHLYVYEYTKKLPISRDIFSEIAIAGGCPAQSVLAREFVSSSYMMGLQELFNPCYLNVTT